MRRALATVGIVALLALTAALPWTGLGRRGAEAAARSDAPGAPDWLGRPFPELSLRTVEGAPVSWESLRGHRVLVTFERSVDW